MTISRFLVLVLTMLMCMLVVNTASAQTPAPVLFFTDLDSGPNTGGETVVSGYSGAYVTIYGNFFGTAQGSSTITWNGLNCLRVVPSTGSYGGWGQTYSWYQKIIVQIGSSCTAGTGNFVVTTTSGISNGVPFTVRTTGHIYFVSTTGSDSTGTGSISAPFASPAHCTGVEVGGDVCYLENGVTQSTAGPGYGYGISIMTGGSAGSPIALVAYPGATATIGSSSLEYGIRVPEVSGVSNASYWTFAGLYLIGGGSGGVAMNANNGWSHWRIVANNMQCPTANGDMGCFESDQVTYIKFYGNEVTNVGVSAASKLQHAVYFCTDSNHVEAGWNYIHNNLSCRAIQVYSSAIGAGTGNNQYDISLHDNLIHDDPCDGMNIATVDPSQGKVEAYNNVIYHVGLGPDPSDGEASYACIRIANFNANNSTTQSGIVEVYNNTLYDCGSFIGTYGFSGTLATASGNVGIDWRNNIASQLSGEYFVNSGTGASGLTLEGSNDIWYGATDTGDITWTTGNITTNPQFVSTSTPNFQPQSTSPAVGAGIAITSSNTYNSYPPWQGGTAIDVTGLIRPSPPSIGAYELTAGAQPVRPNPPTNLTVTVN